MRHQRNATMMAEFDNSQDATAAFADIENLPVGGHLHCSVHHSDEHLGLVRAENHLVRRVGISMALGAPLGALVDLGLMLRGQTATPWSPQGSCLASVSVRAPSSQC